MRIYLHCGLPRTGTTSLQNVLSRNRAELRRAGIDHPDRWQGKARGKHDLAPLLVPPRDPESIAARSAAVRELQAYIRQASAESVLLSDESLNFWVFRGCLEPLSGLLAALREVASLTCIWTLRRIDEFFTSLYLHQLSASTEKRSVSTPDVYQRNALETIEVFMKTVRELWDEADETIYLRYRRDGRHQDELLGAIGLDGALREGMATALGGQVVMNGGMSHKAACAVLNREKVAARVGAPGRGMDIVRLERNGRLRFAVDGPCELFGQGGRRVLHARAMDSAQRIGFAPYADLFGAEELVTGPVTPLHVDVLTAGDLEAIERELVGR